MGFFLMLPSAVIAHRVPTAVDACNTMCKCFDLPSSLLTHYLFLFYSTDQFVFAIDGLLVLAHNFSFCSSLSSFTASDQSVLPGGSERCLFTSEIYPVTAHMRDSDSAQMLYLKKWWVLGKLKAPGKNLGYPLICCGYGQNVSTDVVKASLG